MILHSLTFARSLGKVENRGLRPRFSTLPLTNDAVYRFISGYE